MNLLDCLLPMLATFCSCGRNPTILNIPYVKMTNRVPPQLSTQAALLGTLHLGLVLLAVSAGDGISEQPDLVLQSGNLSQQVAPQLAAIHALYHSMKHHFLTFWHSSVKCTSFSLVP